MVCLLYFSLTRLTSAQGRREADCKTHAKDTWDAVEWLRANKERFHGKVFEPVRLQVQVALEYRHFVEVAEGPITMGSMNVSQNLGRSSFQPRTR